MTRTDFAAELERFAAAIVELPGVSRRNPHEFAEAKSELAGRLRRRAIELREVPQARADILAGHVRPGLRVIDGRPVPVVTRRSA